MGFQKDHENSPCGDEASLGYVDYTRDDFGFLANEDRFLVRGAYFHGQDLCRGDLNFDCEGSSNDEVFGHWDDGLEGWGENVPMGWEVKRHGDWAEKTEENLSGERWIDDGVGYVEVVLGGRLTED